MEIMIQHSVSTNTLQWLVNLTDVMAIMCCTSVKLVNDVHFKP